MKLFLWDIELVTKTYDKPQQIVDIADITIPDAIPDGEYVLKAIIRDEKWYSDSRSVKITLWWKESDTVPPYLIQDKVKVSQNEDGSTSVILLFADEASWIGDGYITSEWTQIYSFKWNLATFTTDKTGDINYQVYDTSGNEVSWKIVIDSPDVPAPVIDEPQVEEVPEEVAEEVVEEVIEDVVPEDQTDTQDEEAPAEPEPEQVQEVVSEPEGQSWSLTQEQVEEAVNNLFPNG